MYVTPGTGTATEGDALESHDPRHSPQSHPDQDESAWFRTFEEFASLRTAGLIRTARAILLNDDDANEAAAEVLAKVAEKFTKISRLDTPDAYIQRMVKNQCLSSLRKISRRKEVLSEQERLPEESVSDGSEEHAQRDEIARSLQKLTPMQRIVLYMRFYEDKSFADIALELNVKEATARSHAAEGYARLRQELHGRRSKSYS